MKTHIAPPRKKQVLVQKYGGTSVATAKHILAIADRVANHSWKLELYRRCAFGRLYEG